MADAPPRIKEALLAAFDIYALYSKDTDQVTIRAVLTEDTPGIIAALLGDPRTDDDTGHQPAQSTSQTPAQDAVSQLGRGTPVPTIIHEAKTIHENFPISSRLCGALDRHGRWDMRDSHGAGERHPHALSRGHREN
jgi:hypothetical protein